MPCLFECLIIMKQNANDNSTGFCNTMRDLHMFLLKGFCS